MCNEPPYYKHEKFSIWKLFFLSDRKRGELLLRRLLLFSQDHWGYFHEEFNNWIFPHGFRDLRPFWWDQKGKKIGNRMFRLNRNVCDTIRRTIPQKELLRYHNVGRGCMTNDEYEYWWHISHEDNSNNIDLSYYQKREELDKLHWWEDDIWAKLKEILGTNVKEQTK